jgi:hypothetical protein
MHWKSMEADRADGTVVNTKCQRQSKWSELVRTGWYLSGVTSAACRT